MHYVHIFEIISVIYALLATFIEINNKCVLQCLEIFIRMINVLDKFDLLFESEYYCYYLCAKF